MTKKRVFIADDDLARLYRDQAEYLAPKLGLDYEVSTAASAETSLTQTAATRYDLILHDFDFKNTPGAILTGADFYLQCDDHTRSKTVFVTSDAPILEKRILTAMPQANLRIIVKPLRMRVLSELLSEYLSQ